jgi:formate hydrogenlyase subunit 3/multisubunit Na+/H+ antiporter MnhD subunit
MQIGPCCFLPQFLNQYAWLRNLEEIKLVLKWIGGLCIVSAGVLAAFQKNLNRILGYLYLSGTGYIVLSMAFQQQGWLELLTLYLLPRALSYWVIGYVFSLMRNTDSEQLDFAELTA